MKIMPTPSLPQTANLSFPVKMKPLFQPHRYKIFYGGRSAGRSWGCARALLLLGVEKKLRILCTREFQNSIADSVIKLLSDQIAILGLQDFYKVFRDSIVGANGTNFAFEGIKNNIDRIKSFEGIDICWVEEGDKVPKKSWGVLIPTIRKDAPYGPFGKGSEIWVTFNPGLATDYTYRNFVLDPSLRPSNWADDTGQLHSGDGIMESDLSVVVKMTYKDNPWFPSTLQSEIDRDKERDFDYYLNVWEGECIQHLEGAVYAKELRRLTAEGRIRKVPWERSVPVDTFWDLGRADCTAIWFGQMVGMEYRIVDYLEDSLESIVFYLKELQKKEYDYGTMWLPHDAKAKTLGTGRSIEEVIRSRGYRTQIVKKLTVADGINAARMVFANCWFDQDKCELGLDRLRHYSYKVIDGQFSSEPMHDINSHGADAFRMLGVSMKGPRTKVGAVRDRMEEIAAAARGERQSSWYSQRGKSSNLGWME